MTTTRVLTDLAQVHRAIVKVVGAARAEGAAISELLDSPNDGNVQAMHHAHLEELNEIQALSFALEVIERRAPSLMRALERKVK